MMRKLEGGARIALAAAVCSGIAAVATSAAVTEALQSWWARAAAFKWSRPPAGKTCSRRRAGADDADAAPVGPAPATAS
jgi:hypothetical protein